MGQAMCLASTNEYVSTPTMRVMAQLNICPLGVVSMVVHLCFIRAALSANTRASGLDILLRHEITRAGGDYVSSLSLVLTDKEMYFFAAW